MRRTEDIRFAQLDAQRAAEDAARALRENGPPVEVVEGEEIVFEIHRPRENFSLEPGQNPFQPNYNPGRKRDEDENKENRYRISEGAEVGTKVGSVTATDDDDAENGFLRYFIADGNQLKLFEMDQSTGDLIVAGKLDRETVAEFRLIVTAQDLGESSCMCTV